jgi:hypothetical protein
VCITLLRFYAGRAVAGEEGFASTEFDSGNPFSILYSKALSIV